MPDRGREIRTPLFRRERDSERLGGASDAVQYLSGHQERQAITAQLMTLKAMR